MSTVQLTPLTETERERLNALFKSGAARVDVADEHWIHGHDEGLSYCYTCAKAKVGQLLKDDPDEEYEVDGGWGIEGDSLEHCEMCGRRLYNSLTNYGCESELEHFLGYGFSPFNDDDCYSLERCVSSRGWEPYDFLHMRDYERRDQAEYFAGFYALCREILKLLDSPRPRAEAKALRARRNARRTRGHRRSYWWNVYHRWAPRTPTLSL